jgi:uncharacterized phage protein (TIGR02220 family)
MKHNAKSVLSSDAFWIVNKRLAKTLKDIPSAVLLSYLVDKEDYHRTKNELIVIENDEGDSEEWFFCTSDRMEDAITLSYKQQKRCLKILEQAGLISQQLIGVPAKLHFTIRHNKILHLVTSSIAKRSKLDLPKGNDIIRTYHKEHNNKNITTEGANAPNGVPPSSVKNNSTREKNIAAAAGIIDHLNELTGRRFSTDPKKGSILMALKAIKKAKPDRLKKMIELKVWEWGKVEDMRMYLQPETLFGNKCAKYLEQLERFENDAQYQKDMQAKVNGKGPKLAGPVSQQTAERLKSW